MDVTEIEKKWQKIWKEKNIFVPQKNEKEKFFATVAYPYANAALHIGHGRTFTTADIYTRFQRLKGKNALFPMGFHSSGTPVLAVAEGIKREDQKQLEMTRAAIKEYVKDDEEVGKILHSFEDPANIAKFFSSKIEETFDTIGLSIDWTRQFTTGDEAYNKFIQWQYQKLKDAGMLVQGKYPILYSPSDQNAVGEDDIKDGDLDKVTIQNMSYILFKLGDEYLAVTTLRPDALFGATNMWVNKDMDLVKMKVHDQNWIVAKAAVEKIEHQFDDVEVLDELKGESLIGKNAVAPIIEREVPIINAEFIDEKHGTGIVYSSPAGSPHDYMALQEAAPEIEVINTVDMFDKKKQKLEFSICPAASKVEKYTITTSTDPKLEDAKQELYKEEHYGGVLNDKCGEFMGIPIKKAKDLVHAKLEELNLGGTFYETSRRAVTRAGDEVIVANLDGQWFLDYSHPDIKLKAYGLLERMNYLPKQMKHSQQKYLEWVEKRPCARKRGLGTKLPFDEQWIIEPLSDSTIYQMYYIVANYVNEGIVKEEELTLEFFDYVFLGKGEGNESAQKVRDDVLYWKSCDFRYTNPPHMSNHLSFLIYHYAVIFPEELQPTNITVGGLLIRNGEKISKSKGNGIPLIHVREKYGADLYRLYVAVATSFDSEMDFQDEEIFQLKKKFERWKDLMFQAKKTSPKEELTHLNKWLLSSFYSKINSYFEAMDICNFREAYIGVLYEFLNDINYHERRTSEEETVAVLKILFDDYVKLMAPVIPHVCEELYEGHDELVSVASFAADPKKYIDEKIMDVEQIAQEILSTIPRIAKGEFKKALLVQAKDERFKLFDALREKLNETKDFKEIMGSLQGFEDKKFIQKFVPKTLGEGLSHYLPKEKEKAFLEEFIPFLKDEFKCEVEILDADNLEKSNAIPGRPGVLLE